MRINMNFTETRTKYHRPYMREVRAQTGHFVRVRVIHELSNHIVVQVWGETWYEMWVKVNCR